MKGFTSLMKGFTLLKRSCPICNGARNDCRQSGSTNWIHCHDDQANPQGYVFRGHDKQGFAMWQFWKDAEAFDSKSKEEWEREREQQRIEWERQKQARISKQLPVEELDKLYRQILNQLRLSTSDRLHLKQQRGFTDEQIERDGYRSVDQWQKVQGKFPANLSGVLKVGFGKTTLNVQKGIIYPVKNEDGLVVGLHIRKSDDSEGRYRFLTSATKKNPEGATPHVNGELPVAVFEPREKASKAEAIWGIEGLGIKPSIARDRLNVPVVGANGGNFASSPELSKAALAKVAAKYQTNKIIAAPDAGDVVNPQAFQKWKKQLRFFQELGYEIEVAWWQQVEKGKDRDIDELSDFERELIQFINVDEFCEIGEQAQKELTQRQKEEEEAKQRAIEDARYRELTSITETPWKVVNTPRLNLDELGIEPGYVHIIVSSKGTNKTNGIAKALVQKLMALLKSAIVSLTHLRSLGRELCEKLGIPWQDDIQLDGVLKLCCTINQSYKLPPDLLAKENSLLLIDELDQVLDQANEDICNKQGERPLIFRAVEQQGRMAVENGGYVVMMSADITQRDIDLVKRIYSDLPVRLIVNGYKPNMGKLYFDESSNPDQLINKLLERCKAGLPSFVVSDFKGSIRGCKSIAELIKRQCPDFRVEEINGDNTKHPEVIEFLKHIDEASKDTDVIICSPAVTSGISIENQRFIGGVFGIFFGVLSVGKACQALARVRGAESIHVWAANKAKGGKKANGLTDPEEIKKGYYYSNYSNNSRHIQSFVAGDSYDVMRKEWLSPWFDRYCKGIALENLEKKAYRRRIKEKLTQEGYEFCKVEESESSKVVSQQLERGYKETSISKAKELDNNGSLMSDEQYDLYKQLKKEPKLTPQEQQFIVDHQTDFNKTVLHHSFGEEVISLLSHKVKLPVSTESQPEKGKAEKEIVELSGYAAAAFKCTGHFKSELDNYHLLKCDINEAAARDWRNEARQLEFSGERFAGDITWHARKKAARDFLGVSQFIDEWKDAEQIPESAFKGMALKIRSHLDLVKQVLGLNLSNPKIVDAQLVVEVLQQVGVKLGKKRERKKKTYQRWIDKESLALCEAYHEHKLKQKAEREAKELERRQAIEAEYQFPETQQTIAISTETRQLTLTEQLIQALAHCETPDTFDMFEVVVNSYPRLEIEAAIAGVDKAHVRHQLTRWLDAIYESQLSQPTQEVESQPVESIESENQHPDLASYREGQEVLFYHPSHKSRWLKGVIESITNGLIRVKAIAGIFGRMIDRSDEILPLLV